MGGLPSKRLVSKLGKDEVLYCIDEKTGRLRRQTVLETHESKWRLINEEAKILMDDDEADYMAVMRYLKGRRL
jgi:hypothetical protein